MENWINYRHEKVPTEENHLPVAGDNIKFVSIYKKDDPNYDSRQDGMSRSLDTCTDPTNIQVNLFFINDADGKFIERVLKSIAGFIKRVKRIKLTKEKDNER